MKICSTCGVEKAVQEFAIRENNRRHTRCKLCTKEYLAEYYKKNKAKSKEYSRIWAANNPDKVKARNARWRNANRETQRRLTKAWHDARPDYHKEYRNAKKDFLRLRRREYCNRNRDRIRAYANRYREENKKKLNARVCLWKKENREAANAIQRQVIAVREVKFAAEVTSNQIQKRQSHRPKRIGFIIGGILDNGSLSGFSRPHSERICANSPIHRSILAVQDRKYFAIVAGFDMGCYFRR